MPRKREGSKSAAPLFESGAFASNLKLVASKTGLQSNTGRASGLQFGNAREFLVSGRQPEAPLTGPLLPRHYVWAEGGANVPIQTHFLRALLRNGPGCGICCSHRARCNELRFDLPGPDSATSSRSNNSRNSVGSSLHGGYCVPKD